MYSADELRAAGYEPWDGRARSTARSSRPTTRSTARSTSRQLGGATVVVDGRGVLDGEALAAAGVRVLRIGRPSD